MCLHSETFYLFFQIFSGTDKFIYSIFINKAMKIREVLDKKIGDTEYKRFITILPKDIVKESRLLGKELKAVVKEGKIILEEE